MKIKIQAAVELESISRMIRRDIINSLSEAGSGHTGGSLDLADIFTCLYFNILNHQPANPLWEDRDRLVLSIGHVAPVLYTTLAHAGYFPVEELSSLRKKGSRLQGHPSKLHGLPGIEVSSGSLGQGLSVAVGMALASRLNKMDNNIYCILGDGEMQEGSVWEAAMSAAHHKLNKLIALIDRNTCQIDGNTSDVMEIEPLFDKWISFGWNVLVCDGHHHTEIIQTFEKAKLSIIKPTVIIAKTIMGKGIKSIEENYRWHGRAPDKDEALNYLKQLSDEQV